MNGVTTEISLFYIIPLGVDTMAASIMDLNLYWSSHFPAYLYNFLMFSKYVCL